MRAARIVSARVGSDTELVADARAQWATAAPRTYGRRRTALVWGALGFLAGAGFWHLVGFWAFLSEIVLDRTPAAQAALAAPPAPSTSPVPKVIVVDAARCTALALDRRSNFTMALPCPSDGLALRHVPQDGDAREDLAALATRLQAAAGYHAD